MARSTQMGSFTSTPRWVGWVLGHDHGPAVEAVGPWELGGGTLPGSGYRPDLDDPDAQPPWTYPHHIHQPREGEVAAWLAAHGLDLEGPDPDDGTVSEWRP